MNVQPIQQQQPTKNELDPQESLFFSNIKLNSSAPAQTAADKKREKNYKEKIKGQSIEAQRTFRKQRDLRYLHKKAKNKKTQNSNDSNFTTPQICLFHINGRCDNFKCERSHEMRLPKLFSVCKFYVTNSCTKGSLCPRMHSEFPCKFYYLGMPHPKNIDPNNCRFTHGDVLNDKIKKSFLLQIEHWVKEMVNGDQLEIEKQMNEMKTRFYAQEEKLLAEHHAKLEENSDKIKQSNEMASSSNACFSQFESSLCDILSQIQLNRLAADNIISIKQIQKMAVDELEKYKLTIDQIYQIHMIRKQNSIELDAVDKSITETKAENIVSKITKPLSLDLPLQSSIDSGMHFNESPLEAIRDEPQSEISSSEKKHLDETENSDEDSDSEKLFINEND